MGALTRSECGGSCDGRTHVFRVQDEEVAEVEGVPSAKVDDGCQRTGAGACRHE